jgi:hypothetical protein
MQLNTAAISNSVFLAGDTSMHFEKKPFGSQFGTYSARLIIDDFVILNICGPVRLE